jgi:heat shock protein 5
MSGCHVIGLVFFLSLAWAAQDYVIGIDLGTCNSVVAAFKNGRAEVIANELGSRITPSWVHWDENGAVIVGEAARGLAISAPERTVFEMKRMIGRSFAEVQRDTKLLPYKIVNNSGAPAIEMVIKGETKRFTPEEVSAHVLRKLKQTAEAYLGVPVKRAVITVPAFFNDAARQATRDAGTIAGLQVENLLSEPTSASIAYGHDTKLSKKERTIMVVDIGAGTTDATVLTVDDGVYDVQTTSGDTQLGGTDIDAGLMDYELKQFEKKTALNARSNKRAIERLRKEVERVKIALSVQPQARLEIEAFHEGHDLSDSMTRARFEDLNRDLFARFLVPLKQALTDAKLSKAQIDDVVLVGGPTRTPKIQQILTDFFGKAPLRTVNPDEAVALGAAIKGAILGGEPSLQDDVVLDVIALSQGIETVGGVMTTLISRNRHIPAFETKTFSTAADNQDRVEIKVYEGERPQTRDNRLLGTFTLKDIAPAPRGVPQIDVTLDVDANGILTVSALDKTSGRMEKVRIDSNKGRLSPEEIKRLLDEAEEYRDADAKARDRIDARNRFESAVLSARREPKKPEAVAEAAEDALTWLEQHPDATKEAIDAEAQRFRERVAPYIGGAEKEMPPHEDL